MKAERTKSQRYVIGFSLVLLLLSIAACQDVSKPVVSTKSAANETAAIAALRSIASAQSLYFVSHSSEYGSFDQLTQGGNLDSRFKGEQPVVGGYVFSMSVSSGSYSVNADPKEGVAAGSTGGRHFFMESSDNAIHFNLTKSASASDPTL
jgi:ApbE superfamily uncharacterized protein (UPF0280 family)